MLQTWTCHCGQPNAGPSPCSACLNAAPPGIAAHVVPAAARPSRAVVATAVATAVLLVASVVSAGVLARRDEPTRTIRAADGDLDLGPEGRTVEVTPDLVPPPGAAALDRELPGLMRFVQETRGLPFKEPVSVTLLPDKAFRARLMDTTEEDKAEAEAELEVTQRLLEGLGLLERGIDLDAAVESLFGDAVAGFYDPETDDLVVRGERLSPNIRTTLVHEFVHALQDQHFDIDREDLDERDDEASTGFTGLVEGDAVRVERLYLDSLSSAQQKAAEAEEAAAGGGIDPDIPPVLLQLVAFPYIYGPEFTSAVFESGGQAALDRAYAEPPSTSEHLLHPESFLDGRPVQILATPIADGEALDEGVLGELGLLLVLNLSGRSGERAAEGWGGDRYVAWRDGDDTCVRVTVATDSPQDDAELRAALVRLADQRDKVEFTGRGPFTFTSCG